MADPEDTTILVPCRCGGAGEIRPGHYPDWAEVHCLSCDRIEFGRDEPAAIRKWNGE